MYFLLEKEWITIKSRICPTQTSTVRMDKARNGISRLDLLIQLFPADKDRWDNMNFSGYSPNDFLNASSASAAFTRVSRALIRKIRRQRDVIESGE